MAKDLMDDQFGSFSREDFSRVISAISQIGNDDKYILVGGQSLVSWVIYFGIDISKRTKGIPTVTSDLDLFSSNKSEVLSLGNALRATLYIADNFDPSPNTAIAIIKNKEGQKLQIDFLRFIHGLTDQEVISTAVKIDVDGGSIKVLHPLMCLKSRLENLQGIPSKRNEYGVLQAEIAVHVVSHYIRAMVSNSNMKQAMRAALLLSDIAASKAGVYVRSTYGINPLDAVDPSLFAAHYPKFTEIEWPKRVARINRIITKGKSVLSAEI